jgi:hypothetical protein
MKLYIFYMNNVKYTRDKTREKPHTQRALQNVNNATTQITHKHLNKLYTITKYIFLYSCRFNIVSSSDPIREKLLHLCTIKQRYSIYTKVEKLHDKTTSHKLEKVDLHYHRTIEFSMRLLYTYTPLHITFCLPIPFFVFITYVIL